jgi:hypothetical protein
MSKRPGRHPTVERAKWGRPSSEHAKCLQARLPAIIQAVALRVGELNHRRLPRRKINPLICLGATLVAVRMTDDHRARRTQQ